jgi:hypothetical protein
MINKLGFIPEIEEDVMDGYLWYKAKSSELGNDFLQMFYSYANDIMWNPLIYPRVFKEFRRCLIKRFPYSIYFTIIENQIFVVGFFHCSRDPRTIGLLLQERVKTDII